VLVVDISYSAELVMMGEESFSSCHAMLKLESGSSGNDRP